MAIVEIAYWAGLAQIVPGILVASDGPGQPRSEIRSVAADVGVYLDVKD